MVLSCPSRGTWIEIAVSNQILLDVYGRAPRGARGLKCSSNNRVCKTYIQSCPSRGTWIEIQRIGADQIAEACRAPRGARGLKYPLTRVYYDDPASCPSRGTWIEIEVQAAIPAGTAVVPLAGHVD